MFHLDRILLSFVVPVYNVEKYLNECLDSIFDESADEGEFEVVAVNDGSTDSSPEILKTYSSHKNFQIITQENGGISVARNSGIQAAAGEYIAFIDSDDFLLPGAVPALIDFARQSNSDIIEFSHEVTDETSLGIRSFQPTTSRIPMFGSGKEVFPQWRAQHAFMSVTWVRIYKRKLLTDNNLFFYPGIMHEDEEWTHKCFFYAASVIFYPLAIYNYRRRDDSITSKNMQGTYRRCKDLCKVIDSLEDFVGKIADNPANAEFLRALNSVIAGLYRANINFLTSEACKDTTGKKKIAAELMKRKHLLSIYNYGGRGGSITSLDGAGIYMRCLESFAIIDSLTDFTGKMRNDTQNSDFLRAINGVIVNLYRININFLSSDAGSEVDIFKKENLADVLAKREHLLKSACESKNRFLYCFLKIFSLKTTLKLLNLMDKM